MRLWRRRRKPKPGLVSIAPIEGGIRLAEDISPMWLWVSATLGILLVLLAAILDLVWEIKNILPSIFLELGAGALLFALLFLLERRIVRQTRMVAVSAIEEFAARSGQDPEEAAAHFGGPVAVVHEFITAILDEKDYGHAWRLADRNWRLCRAQAWIWNNRNDPVVARYDKEEGAKALSEEEPTHELWDSFAETELAQFTEAWSDPDLRTYGAASARRTVQEGEIVLLVDLMDHPHGAMAHAPTPVVGVSFLVRHIEGAWRMGNLVGDSLPEPGWPPDWREGWRYWEDLQKDHD